MCLNPTFCRGPNLSYFGLGPWAIIHGIAKLANTFISQIWNFMTPFERSLSKLSENHKIVEIGSTEFKLWQRKKSLNQWLVQYDFLKPFELCQTFRWGHNICYFSALDNGLVSMAKLANALSYVLPHLPDTTISLYHLLHHSLGGGAWGGSTTSPFH